MKDTACSKCGSNHRIVVYRREPETYSCAVCVGEPHEGRRSATEFFRSLGPFPTSVLVTSEAPDRNEFGHGPFNAFTRGQARDALDAVVNPRKMPKKYQGYRRPGDWRNKP
jgi:hypothetical protein